VKQFSFKSTEEKIEQQLGIPLTSNMRWSYNIAPTQHAYVILNDAPNVLQYITWGLIPSASRDGKNEGKLINARKEGIGVSSSFRIPIRAQRCLVLADSFYCWSKEGINETPYRVELDDQSIMMMAGVWDIWYKGEYAVKSFSIITKPTTGKLKEIIPRMPVIISDKEVQTNWLEDIPLSRVQSIIDARDTDNYNFYKISPVLRSIKKNDESLHKPA
jgi:putative SOS response-associated peptidase YedK